MNEKLNYYKSIHLPPQSEATVGRSPLPKSLQYHTSSQSTEIALENLKKFNNRLNDNNFITLAFLANNSCVNQEDREKYYKLMKEKLQSELHLYERCIQRIRDKQNEIS